jgi:hypothetical protein
MLIAELFLIACSSSSSTVALAQVKGRVIDASTGQPLEGASLQLRTIKIGTDGSTYASSEPPVSETKTDVAGAFVFKNVPSGQFILINSAFDEVPYLRIMMWKQYGWESVIVDVPAGQVVDLDILQVCHHDVCSPWPTK